MVSGGQFLGLDGFGVELFAVLDDASDVVLVVRQIVGPVVDADDVGAVIDRQVGQQLGREQEVLGELLGARVLDDDIKNLALVHRVHALFKMIG